MAKCLACNEKNAAEQTLCSRCGRALPERAVGDVLGNYRIVRVIGQGGMGCVYEAEHTKLGRHDALKLLQREYCGDPERVRRFFAEARAANRVKHEGVVQIFDFVEGQGGDNYYVMELLEGETLRAIIAREGRLPPARALNIAARVASAVVALHEAALVHGDLKPDNIFVNGAQDEHVKLFDFGLTADAGFEAVAAGGSPAYMAPEAFERGSASPAIDVYAFGIMLFEMLVGRLPFQAADVAGWKNAHTSGAIPDPLSFATMPLAVARLVQKCMSKAPNDRPAELAEIETALRHSLASIQLSQAPSGEQPARRNRSLRWIVPAASAAAVAIVASTALFLQSKHEPAAPVQVAPAAPVPPPASAPAVVPVAAAPAVVAPAPIVRKDRTKKSAKGKRKSRKGSGDTEVIDAFGR